MMANKRKVECTIEMDDGYLIVTNQHPDDFEFVDSEGWMMYFVMVKDAQGREMHLNPSHIVRMVVRYE